LEFPTHECNFGHFRRKAPKTKPTIVSAIQFCKGVRPSQVLEHANSERVGMQQQNGLPDCCKKS
jgi:hypothetical protein